MKSKSIYWNYVLLKIKYIFLRDSYVCTRWIFIFDSDQAKINSVGKRRQEAVKERRQDAGKKKAGGQEGKKRAC